MPIRWLAKTARLLRKPGSRRSLRRLRLSVGEQENDLGQHKVNRATPRRAKASELIWLNQMHPSARPSAFESRASTHQA